MRRARCAAAAKASARPRISSTVSSCGTCQPSREGQRRGRYRLPGRLAGRERLAAEPGHLRRGLAAGVRELHADRRLCVMPRQTSTTRFIAASFRSLYRPVQPCEMRPSRVTPVASMISRPAPEQARLPRCAKCQSLIAPSAALYWHTVPAQKKFSAAALEAMAAYEWPGNVRELHFAVERASLLSEHDLIDVNDLPPEILERPVRGGGSGAPGLRPGSRPRLEPPRPSATTARTTALTTLRKPTKAACVGRSKRHAGVARRRPRSWGFHPGPSTAG